MKRGIKKTILRFRRTARTWFQKVSSSSAAYFRRFRGTEHTFMILAAVVIGLVGGLGGVIIQEMIRFFKRIFWGNWDITVAYLTAVPIWMKLAVPIIGSLIVGLIIAYVSHEAKGHGVPEVMEAIALRNGKIRPRVVFAKLIASSIYIGSGGSVGREGPVIQIGSAVGSVVGQFFRVNPQRMKTFVACGAASGIASAFNAPIAGALFSLEVILGDFGVSQFSPIVISSVLATVVSRYMLGNNVAFSIPEYHLVSPLELIPYSILGILSGVVAWAFIKTLYRIEDFYDHLKQHQALKTASGGLLIGLLGIAVPAIFGVGYDSMDAALRGQLTWMAMLVLVFAKLLATSISLGSGGSGGIFAPSLFLGTMTGGFFGELVHLALPAVTAGSGAYSLVGMAAVVAGATHAPLTAILIIFEMTNDYKIILPLMISSILSVLIARKLLNESIYTLKLVRKGINLFAGRDINILREFRVKDIMIEGYPSVSGATPLKKLLSRMLTEKQDEILVTAKNGRFLGNISLNSIKEYLNDQDVLADIVIASDIMDLEAPTLKANDKLDLAMHIMGRSDHKILPVISNEKEKRLLGAASLQAAVDIYNKELFKRDLTGSFSSMVTGMEEGRTLEVVDNYQLVEVSIPEVFVGKKIRELDIRNSYNVEIILIRSRTQGGADSLQQRPGAIPNADYCFKDGDVVLILGQDQDIRRFRARVPRTRVPVKNEG